MSEYEYQITRNGIKRNDGAVFMKSTFKDDDGITVPLVWDGHVYEPEYVLGHAILENRNEGVFAKLTFCDTENAKLAEKMLLAGDVDVSFSANRIKRDGSLIESGVIRAVHICVCGFKYEEDPV